MCAHTPHTFLPNARFSICRNCTWDIWPRRLRSEINRVRSRYRAYDPVQVRIRKESHMQFRTGNERCRGPWMMSRLLRMRMPPRGKCNKCRGKWVERVSLILVEEEFMLCRNESATYALLGSFPFSLFFLPFRFRIYLRWSYPARLPVLDFPLKKIDLEWSIQRSHRKVPQTPDTIKQEVVKSLLRLHCLA